MRMFLSNTAALTGRSLTHILRSPDTILTTALTPIAMMLMFVYVFGSAIEVGGQGPYVDYLLPGILVMTVSSGIAYTAYRLFMDVSGGIVERLRTMPVARSALLWSHVLTSVVANLAAVGLVLLVALLMGFRSGAGILAWLAALALLALFTLALTWLAVIPGLAATSGDAVSGFGLPLVFLPFVSSAFVPTGGMPGPVRWFAEHQPVTPLVDALRGLYAGQPVGDEAWTAVGWCLGLLVVAYLLAMRTYRRRIGRG
jgi:ABC-2 type transport system permease protein